MKVAVNSIAIPECYRRLCEGWHNGMDCTLYAVASTGGLTIGTTCPLRCRDYNGDEDRDEKWYFVLWCNLSCDVGRARKEACLSNHADCDELMNFEEWIDMQVSRLCQSYGLEDWEW